MRNRVNFVIRRFDAEGQHRPMVAGIVYGLPRAHRGPAGDVGTDDVVRSVADVHERFGW